MEQKYRSILMLSTDSPEQLRPIDVYRVLNEAKNKDCLTEFVKWLEARPISDRVRAKIQSVLKEGFGK